MKLFDSKLMNRLAVWKTIGFIIWLVAFISLPLVFNWTDYMLRFALLFWYTTFWVIIWVFWVWVQYPIFKIKISYWFRWAFMWAWLNFVLAMFMYDKLALLMQWTSFAWYSPFWIVLEWLILWVFIDYIATKCVWEGKELMK